MGDTLRKKPHTNLSGTNGPLHVRRPSLIVGLHPIAACSSSLPSIASHLTAPYLEMTFKWTVTVCEYREQGFMEPPFKDSARDEYVVDSCNSLWENKEHTGNFNLGSGLPDDNSHTSCLSVYFVVVYESDNTWRERVYTWALESQEGRKPPFSAPESPLL